MTFLLVMTVLGDWSYAGFVADPETPPPPAASAGAIANSPDLKPSAPPAVSPREGSENPGSRFPHTPAKDATIPAAPATQRWRLADASGQLWEGSDRFQLQKWVEARNELLSHGFSFPSRP